MGGSQSTSVLEAEQAKPLDGSDCADGDAALAEVKRLRGLLQQVASVTAVNAKELQKKARANIKKRSAAATKIQAVGRGKSLRGVAEPAMAKFVGTWFFHDGGATGDVFSELSLTAILHRDSTATITMHANTLKQGESTDKMWSCDGNWTVDKGSPVINAEGSSATGTPPAIRIFKFNPTPGGALTITIDIEPGRREDILLAKREVKVAAVAEEDGGAAAAQ